MDEKDKIIVLSLLSNGRIPKTKLAELLGITEAAVRKRIAKLESEGIIVGYRAIINYRTAKLAASLTGIDVEPEKIWNVIEKLKEIEGVKQLWLTSGDHTIMAEIIAENTEELSEIHRRIEEIEGVKRICPSVIIDTLKR
ncbi:MAG: Lrp/AsnC ligand binding domain-containing protein [Archaeoglobaceae archaeon]